MGERELEAWILGFSAAAYLNAGIWERYEELRDEYLEARRSLQDGGASPIRSLIEGESNG